MVCFVSYRSSQFRYLTAHSHYPPSTWVLTSHYSPANYVQLSYYVFYRDYHIRWYFSYFMRMGGNFKSETRDTEISLLNSDGSSLLQLKQKIKSKYNSTH